MKIYVACHESDLWYPFVSNQNGVYLFNQDSYDSRLSRYPGSSWWHQPAIVLQTRLIIHCWAIPMSSPLNTGMEDTLPQTSHPTSPGLQASNNTANTTAPYWQSHCYRIPIIWITEPTNKQPFEYLQLECAKATQGKNWAAGGSPTATSFKKQKRAQAMAEHTVKNTLKYMVYLSNHLLWLWLQEHLQVP